MRANAKTSTILITANATTGATAVALPPGGGWEALLSNAGPQIAFVEFGRSTVVAQVATANAGSQPVTANQPALSVTIPQDATHVAAVSAGNSSIYLTRGQNANP